MMCSAPRSAAATNPSNVSNSMITSSATSNVVTTAGSTPQMAAKDGTTAATAATTTLPPPTANSSDKKLVVNPYIRSNSSKPTVTSVTTATTSRNTSMIIENSYLKTKCHEASTNPSSAATTLSQTVIQNPYLKKNNNLNGNKPAIPTPIISTITTNKTIQNPYLKSRSNIRSNNENNNNDNSQSAVASVNNSNVQGVSLLGPHQFSNTQTVTSNAKHVVVGILNNSSAPNQNSNEENQYLSQTVSKTTPNGDCYAYTSPIKYGMKSSGSTAPTPTIRNISIAATSGPSPTVPKPSTAASAPTGNTTTTATASAPTRNSTTTATASDISEFFKPSKAASSSPFIPGPIPIDPSTKNTYIYPVNPNHPKRAYQCDIARTALFHNTLVSLPTGLGKTLIAAVVMYNYRRWFHGNGGKVVFCAPTRPLVTQQIKACYQIMGMPLSETAEISGKTPPVKRKELWKNRHVFFCTPQTLMKDLSSGNINGSSIVCLVLDEAHKAKGKYDYVSVIPLLEEAGARFRIVGLSATPGTTVKSIQEVITNLHIAKIEVRFETDVDVLPYIHDRQMEIVIVKTNAAVSHIEQLWLKVLKPILEKLRKNNALITVRAKDAAITSWCVKRAQQEWHARHENDDQTRTYLDQWFCAAAKLVGITQDLRSHGIGVVKAKLSRIVKDPRFPVMRTTVAGKEFNEAWTEILAASSSNADGKDLKKNNPKLEKLEEVLIEHFERKKAVGESTRAIVFCQYRDAVEEIVNVLLTKEPLLKPSKFVGQASTSSARSKSHNRHDNATLLGTAGMKQWEQQQAIQDFSSGKINVLVCTCIGEEGLDIGEVDLIVNFDCLKSPIRMIQRVGRTGRKRDGRVICLVAEGAEQSKYAQSEANTKTLARALKQIKSFQFYHDQTPASSHAIFPLDQPLPQIHEQEMDLSEDYKLSQVGGYLKKHKSSKTTGRSYIGVDTCSTFSEWRLTLEQEEVRRREFGELTSFFFNALSHRLEEEEKPILFPVILRRKFLRTRQRCSDIHKHSASMGITRSILKQFQQKFCTETLQNSSPSGIHQYGPGRNEWVQHHQSQASSIFSSEVKSHSSDNGTIPATSHGVGDIKLSVLNDKIVSARSYCNDIFIPATKITNLCDVNMRKIICDTVSTNPNDAVSISNQSDSKNHEIKNNYEKAGSGILFLFSEEARRRASVEAPPYANGAVRKEVPSTMFLFSQRQMPESLPIKCKESMPDGKKNSSVQSSMSKESFKNQIEMCANEQKMRTYNTGSDVERHDIDLKAAVNFEGLFTSEEENFSFKDSCADADLNRHSPTTFRSKIDEHDFFLSRTSDQSHELPDIKDDSSKNYIVNFRLPTPVSSSDSSDCSSKDSENNYFCVGNISTSSEHAGGKNKFGQPLRCGDLPDKGIADRDVEKIYTPVSFLLPAQSFSSSSNCSSDDSAQDLGTDEELTVKDTVKAEVAIDKGEHVSNSEASKIIADSEQTPYFCTYEKSVDCVKPQHRQGVEVASTKVLHDTEVDLNASMDETPVVSVRRKGRRNFILSEVSSPADIASSDIMSSYTEKLCESARLSSYEKEEDIICLLCHCADSTDEDPIVLCDGPVCDYSCNVAVHKSCYQINMDLDLIESWRCEPCEELHMQQKSDRLKSKTTPIFCSICKVIGGAMKRTPAPENLWVHPLCMYWTPQYATLSTVFQEGNRLGGGEIITVSDLQKAQNGEESLECIFCRRKLGSVKCSEPACREYAHPHCAVESHLVEKRWFYIHHRLSSNLDKNVSYKFAMYCPNHKPYAARLVGRNGDHATEIFGGSSAWKKRNRTRVHFEHPPSQHTQAIGLVDSDEDCENHIFMDVANHQKRRLVNRKWYEARKQQRSNNNCCSKKQLKTKIFRKKSPLDDVQVRRFFDVEAEIDSNEDISSDSDEERLVRRMEEEYSQDSFIDDSTQLMYSQYYLSAPRSAISPGNDDSDVMLHRRVNNEIEKSKLFATPILNRRMRRSPGCSGGSLSGLGNMCFIRSVIEHHRQGGGMTQIESEFHRHSCELQEKNFIADEPKSMCEKEYRANGNAIGSSVSKENEDLIVRRPDYLKSDSCPNDSLKIDLLKCIAPDVANHPPTLSSAHQHHDVLEGQGSTVTSVSGNLTEEELGALIERKRQEALKRYKQKMSNAIKNPYLKKT